MRYRDYCKAILQGRTFEDAVIQYNLFTPAQLSAFIARAEVCTGVEQWHERLFEDMYPHL